jgi:hypothetical protein
MEYAMSSPTDPPSCVAGYTLAHALPDRRVAVKSGVADDWHVMSVRDWMVLQHAATSGEASAIATQTSVALQTLLGVRSRLEASDGFPPWFVSAVLAISPALRPYRDELRPVTTLEVNQLVDRFVRLKLLVPIPPRTGAPSTTDPLKIGIVTADRPEALKRLLEHLRAGVSGPGEPVTIEVHDNSQTILKEEENAALCALAQTPSVRVEHWGNATRTALFAHLVRHGIAPEIARFALTGAHAPRTGANRNAALLASVGHRLLMLDDDVVPRVWVPWRTRSGIKLTNLAQPRVRAFARTAAGLFKHMIQRPEPVWRGHASVLGLTVSAAIERHGLVDVAEASVPRVPSWGALVADGGGRVRVSLHGVIGDSGMGWLRSLLTMEDPERRSLVEHRAIYEATCRTGVLRETTSCVELTTSGTAPIGGMAIDATDLLPPFMPSHRCQDLLFLDVLRLIDRSSVAAFVPHTIEHWPIEDRSQTRAPIWSNTGIRFYTVAHAIIASRCSGLATATPSARLETIGQAFREAGAASIGDLQEFVRSVWLHHVANSLDVTERALSVSDGPSWWVEDVGRFREKLLAEASDRACSLPRDLGDIGEEPLHYMKTMFTKLGSLYSAWPAIWSAARAYRG